MAESQDKGALPAPYQSPWDALRRDVPAALADLRLRARELWRRNREGDLSTPGFWPQDLAPLFWPLLLVLVVALLVLGVLQLKAALAPEEAPEPPGIERILTTPLPEARPLAALPEPVPSEPVAAEPIAAEPVAAEPEVPLLQVTPLLKLLAEVDRDSAMPEGLLLTAQPLPERNGAVLTLDAKQWRDLPPSQRLDRTEAWWEQLQEEGYEDLTLEDTDHHLLARPSRVGTGMIMFDPQTTP
jgi:hypothetical protein